jgi:hypothetical protein
MSCLEAIDSALAMGRQDGSGVFESCIHSRRISSAISIFLSFCWGCCDASSLLSLSQSFVDHLVSMGDKPSGTAPISLSSNSSVSSLSRSGCPASDIFTRAFMVRRAWTSNALHAASRRRSQESETVVEVFAMSRSGTHFGGKLERERHRRRRRDLAD